MIPRPLLVALALFGASFAFACNGGDGDGAQDTDRETATPTIAGLDAILTPDGTSPVETVANIGVTPSSLDELRANLQARLEVLGVNVGAVPEDVREELVNYCLGLKEFVQDGEVDEICATISEAIEQGDPELIELVLSRLSTLSSE